MPIFDFVGYSNRYDMILSTLQTVCCNPVIGTGGAFLVAARATPGTFERNSAQKPRTSIPARPIAALLVRVVLVGGGKVSYHFDIVMRVSP